MLFSIIIPVYKVEKYLKLCVESILSQSFTDYEVILVDDGSPDSCPSICDEFARVDNRIIAIHQENMGLAGARNTGLANASGEYIIYVDSDDYLAHSNVLAILADNTQSQPDIIHYKFCEWFESDGLVAECKFKYNVAVDNRSLADVYCDLIDKDAYFNSAWSKAIRRRLLTENHIEFERGIVGEDNEWYYHVVMAAKSLILVDEPLYIYRRRKGSITTSLTRKNLEDQLHVLSKWLKELDNKQEDSRRQVVIGSLAKQYCSALIIYSQLTGVKDLYPQLKEKKHLLNYTKTKRVVVFKHISRMLGLKGLIILLAILNKIK